VKSTLKKVTVYIPGRGHLLQAFSTILIRGGRTRDLPGLFYEAIRGKFDFGMEFGMKEERVKNRSWYGIKNKNLVVKKEKKTSDGFGKEN